MSKPSLLFHPSLDGNASSGEITHDRPSLFYAKDAFIERIAPVATAAIYFGGFSLAPQDLSLSHQALFKLSFLHRHFLHPGGIRIAVEKETAVLSGTISNPLILVMAEILALQVAGVREVRHEIEMQAASDGAAAQTGAGHEAIQLLFATDQTFRSRVQVGAADGKWTLDGKVSSAAQKNWAEQLAQAATDGEILSRLEADDDASVSPASNKPLAIDDESLQALVLFRLRLVRETEHVPVKVQASRSIVSLQGKVRTEALRQRVENLARSTLGVHELRSTLSIVA